MKTFFFNLGSATKASGQATHVNQYCFILKTEKRPFWSCHFLTKVLLILSSLSKTRLCVISMSSVESWSWNRWWISLKNPALQSAASWGRYLSPKGIGEHVSSDETIDVFQSQQVPMRSKMKAW